MKKQVLACVLVAVISIGLLGISQRVTFADTIITEEDMEDGEDDFEEAEVNWQMDQSVDIASCKQGKDVILTVNLTGNRKAMKVSTVYAVLQYDPGVFEVDAANITPNKPELVDYISFNEDSGELDVYYVEDVSFENGACVLRIKLHALDDANIGITRIGLNSLEMYATDADDYAVVEDNGTVKVKIKENASVTVAFGDVNRDGKINLTDVKLIMKQCNGQTKLSAKQKKNADVNHDGKINLTDAKLVMKYCNGEIAKF